MKEASGEANLTVVAIILIGVIVAVVTPIIQSMMQNTKERACCMDGGGQWENGTCSDTSLIAEGSECMKGSTETN